MSPIKNMALVSLILDHQEIAILRAALLRLPSEDKICKSLNALLPNKKNEAICLRLNLDEITTLQLGLSSLYECTTDITQAEEVTVLIRKVRKKKDALLFIPRIV